MSDTLLHLMRRQDSPVAQFGPIFMGIVANYFLWGIQFVQTYYYYTTFRETDRAWMKTAVVMLFITDAAQTIACTQGAWEILVAGWGKPESADRMGWGLIMIPLTDSVAASVVHAFYGQKIWTLLNSPYKYIWTTVIAVCSCAQLIAGLGGSIFEQTIHITFSTFDRFTNWATVWFVSAAVTDIIIAALMSWKLSNTRSAYKETNEIISKTIRLVIETGVATSVVQIIGVILQQIFPVKSYVIFPGEMTSKLYSNSMLALLNSRRNTQLEWGSKIYKHGESIQLGTVVGGAPGNVEYGLEANLADKGERASTYAKRRSLEPQAALPDGFENA